MTKGPRLTSSKLKSYKYPALLAVREQPVVAGLLPASDP
jgi:hypothetical protein